MHDSSSTAAISPPRAAATDEARSIPRYRSIASAVRHDILVGTYPPGSLLPSEAELAGTFGVTRMTVRQALAGLATEGIIERRHGHGTIVVPIKHQRQPQTTLGLTDELIARGLVPGSRVLRIEEIRPTPAVRDLLWIGARGRAIRLRRLRYADSKLIGLQETIIASRYAPDLLELDLTDRSLARILRERHGLAASWTDLTIEAVEADKATASALDVLPGTALLRSTSVSFLADGRPLERTVGWFPGTRYSYKLPRVSAPADRAGTADIDESGEPGMVFVGTAAGVG